MDTTRRTSEDHVSYSSIYELANFPHVLKLERETVNRYVREVFPQ